MPSQRVDVGMALLEGLENRREIGCGENGWAIFIKFTSIVGKVLTCEKDVSILGTSSLRGNGLFKVREEGVVP
jgi:hypothetical protein